MKLLATGLLTIGELSARSGVASSALRYYESLGLISALRTDSNQRRFARSTLRTVALIRVAQGLGLSLDDIARALATMGKTAPAANDWERLSAGWRDDLSDRIARLTRLRDDLTECIGCGCLSLERCALLNPGDAAGVRGSGPRYLLGDSGESSNYGVHLPPP
jgi:MerR family redox-sensitive transcriptional activator SoxR